jgi:hypothetical protein
MGRWFQGAGSACAWLTGSSKRESVVEAEIGVEGEVEEVVKESIPDYEYKIPKL